MSVPARLLRDVRKVMTTHGEFPGLVMLSAVSDQLAAFCRDHPDDFLGHYVEVLVRALHQARRADDAGTLSRDDLEVVNVALSMLDSALHVYVLLHRSDAGEA